MRRYLILPLIFLSAAIGFAGEVVAPAVPEDPIPWTPPTQRPPFRALKISAEDFKARMIEVGKAYDAFVVNRDKLPEKGMCIESISPNSNAKKLGLREMDLITKVDGGEFDFWA